MKNLEATPFTPGQLGSAMRSAHRTRTVQITAAIFALALGACSAEASILHNTTGLTAPAIVYTFDPPSGQSLGNNAAVSSQFLGFTIIPALYYDGNNGIGDGQCNYGNGNPNCLTNFTTSTDPLPPGQPYSYGELVIPNFSFNFLSPQTFIAFSLVIAPGDVDNIAAYLNGAQVDSETASSGLNGDFYGFTNESFNSVTITTGGSHLALINTIQVGTLVPESGTGAIISLGLVGLFALERHRRLRASA